MEEMKARWADKMDGKTGPRGGPNSGNEKKCGHESGMLFHCITKEIVKDSDANIFLFLYLIFCFVVFRIVQLIKRLKVGVHFFFIE